MRISKHANKKVTSATEPVSKSKYDDSIKHIRAAIDVLGATAKDDPVAKEAIANLSVVLFDLQS